ncbi:MAG: heme utilization protein, partial [Bacteroidota bacterium]
MLLHTSIQRVRVSLRTLKLAIALLLFISFHASAHFGSKGPFGGTVSCAIARDSLVYIGTTNGGVYISSTNGLTAWTVRPVGLTSGKITALAHSGSYLLAGTADSGIFIFNGFVG